MRLDKWLKISRLIKRRTVAHMACEQHRVFVNDQPAKPSLELKMKDKVHLELGSRALTVEVLAIPKGAVVRDEAASLYRITDELRRPPEVLEWMPF